jgi:hypothetical protein
MTIDFREIDGAGAFVISFRLIRKPNRALGGWPSLRRNR